MAWYDSGHTLADLPAGSITIEFKDVSGWRKPANKTVTVYVGRATTTTGTYYLIPSQSKAER